jgi:hypothetical protein
MKTIPKTAKLIFFANRGFCHLEFKRAAFSVILRAYDIITASHKVAKKKEMDC